MIVSGIITILYFELCVLLEIVLIIYIGSLCCVTFITIFY